MINISTILYSNVIVLIKNYSKKGNKFVFIKMYSPVDNLKLSLSSGIGNDVQ